MSGQDLYLNIGAAFGFISVVWMIVSQLFGTYAERTLRTVIERQTQDTVKLMGRMQKLAESLSQSSGRNP